MSVAAGSEGSSPSRLVLDDVVIVRTGASRSELRSIRQAVGEFISDHGGDPGVRADFELAVSELATNVIQHTSARDVTVAMRRGPHTWQLDVYHARRLRRVRWRTPPPPTSASGRGLIVVQAIMDDLTLLDDGRRTFIRCVRNR